MRIQSESILKANFVLVNFIYMLFYGTPYLLTPLFEKD
jgi:hypothetical protein